MIHRITDFMFQRLTLALLAILSLAIHGCRPAAPTPHVEDVRVNLHGLTMVDPYAWMRDRDSPEVLAHLDAENRFTDRMLAPQRGLEQRLINEFESHLDADDESVPHRIGDFIYSYVFEADDEHERFVRRPVDEVDGEPELVLDVNRLAKDQAYVALDSYQPSLDGHWIAYAVDVVGDLTLGLYVAPVGETDRAINLAEDISSFAWAADGKTIYYTTRNDAGRSDKLFRRTLDLPKSRPLEANYSIRADEPELVIEESDTAFDINVQRSRSDAYMLVNITSYNAAETRLIPAMDADAQPIELRPRREGVMDFVDHQRSHPRRLTGGRFLILSDDAGRDFRLLSLPDTVISKPTETRFENPQEVLPHVAGRLLESVEIFELGVVVIYVENARQMLGRLNLEQGRLDPVDMGEVSYMITSGENHRYESDAFRFSYESLATPTRTCELDLLSGEIRVLKERDVPGYDPETLVQERIEATASDGTKIPITLVRHRDHRNGPKPLLLEVYGAYGISNWPWWDETRLSLLNRGMGFAIAHVRGGAEGGRGWHDEAKFLKKETTFTDTIACVNALLEQGITSRETLVLTGASAGGLTVGAVLNMEPGICQAALIGVPFVDVINTMLDESLPLTTQEFFEWGDPKDKPYFEVMRRYSPYDNIRAVRYPDVLVYSSYNDGQVMYWEPAKYVARLRATRTDDRLTLLSMNMSGGHQGPSGRSGAMREIARQYAFTLFSVGLTH